MSSYHSAFSYLGKNSYTDFGLWIAHFSDNADSGETDSFLSTDGVYTDSYDGTRQNFYGAKYNTVATPQITLIKPDGGNFGIEDSRKVLRWLTGARTPSWMDLYVDNEVKYRLLGRVKSVSQYKMDARIVGVVITFESVSPYGYSAPQEVSRYVSGETAINILCDSDELYSCVYMNTSFANTSGDALLIKNNTIGEETEIKNLAQNEIIKISDNMVITSDKPTKTFGDDFNFIFPRLIPGENEFIVNGTGELTFQYIAPVKLGDIAIDLNSIYEPIEDEEGNLKVTTLDWSRVSNTPNTLAGYDIRDAYTKEEIDNMVLNSQSDVEWSHIENKPNTIDGYGITDAYTKEEVNAELAELDAKIATEIEWDKVLDKPTTIAGYGLTDAYTKNEVDAKVTSVYKYQGSVANSTQLPDDNLEVGHVYNLEDTGMNVAWNGTAWDNLGSSVDLTSYLTIEAANNTYAEKDNVYTKGEVDTMVQGFVSDEVYTKQETYSKDEVDALMIIDETTLTARLDEILV